MRGFLERIATWDALVGAALIVLLAVAAGTGAAPSPGPTSTSPDGGPTVAGSSPAVDDRADRAPAFLPSEEETICGVSVPERVGPRRPHPPVRIDGEDPHEPATLATVPAADQPVYRPGSGIVAGNGSADNPFVIAGWRLPRLMIQNTDAHFVVADNRFDPRMERTGTWVDPAEGPGHFVSRTVRNPANDHLRVFDAPNVTVVENVGKQEVLVRDGPGVCIGGNQLEPFGEGEGAILCESPHARVLSNEGLRGLTLAGSPHATVRENAFQDRGIKIAWDWCGPQFSRPGGPQEGLDRRPAFFEHTIPPGNTIDGDPVRYLRDVDGERLTEPDGQLLAYDVRNLTLEDIPLNRTSIAHSRDVVLRNVSAQRTTPEAQWGPLLHLVETPNVTVRESLFHRVPLRFEVTANVTFVDNTVTPRRKVEVTIAHGLRILNNSFEPGNPTLDLNGVDNASIVGNDIRGFSHSIRVLHGSSMEIRGNTIEKASTGIDLRDTPNATVVDNSLTIASFGVVAESSPGLNVSHNAIRSFGPGYIDIGIDAGGAAGPASTSGGDLGARIVGNDIEHSKYGITVFDHVGDVEIHGNNLRDIVFEGVDADGEPRTVDARENWWGCPDGPSAEDCSDATGDVIVDPWLTSPNPEAGPRTG